MVPVAGAEAVGLRALSDTTVCERVLAYLADGSCREESDNWNQRYRENMLHIRSGNLSEVAQVIKSLAARDRERGLSTGEKKMLVSARQILASELSVALDRPLAAPTLSPADANKRENAK